MGYIRFISSLDMRRPLVFLCGPAYQKDNPGDRRLILRKYIDKKWFLNKDNEYLHAFPIVVDDFIKPKDIKNAGLSIQINVIEEIISNISYRTYIFLDTMSTSYELGQFTNFAYVSDNVSIFVDKQYKQRATNSIGDYILESLSDKFIEYDAIYNNRGHIYFPNKLKKGKEKYEIPNSIIEKLQNDNPANLKGNPFYKIAFSTNRIDIANPGTIICEKNGNELVFNFSQKNLFYFVTSVYKNFYRQNIKVFPKSTNAKDYIAFKNELLKELLTSFLLCSSSSSNRSYILSEDFSLLIKCGNLESDSLIYHMLYLSFMLDDYMGRPSYLIYGNKYLSRATEGMAFPDNEVDMLGILNKHFNLRINNFKSENIEKAITKKTLRIKHKTRDIIAYSDTFYGRQLKELHANILESFLSILPSSDLSYAYKKNRNTLMCLNKHIGHSYFLKLDIRKYFESITLSSTANKIRAFIEQQYKERFNAIVHFGRTKSGISSDVLFILKTLFYKYKLPIGFVTSPKISDFYLYQVDKDMEQNKIVTYTRYADDILLSSNNKDELDKMVAHFCELLKNENLSINEKKIRKGSLLNEGDSFKFLGISIVKRCDNFVLTISHKYLVETCKIIIDLILNGADKLNETIVGRITYIKSISRDSLNKLSKLLDVKFRKAGILTPGWLHSILK